MHSESTYEPLTPRRGNILKHVVEEYVVTAQPVSSEVLTRKYVPDISSATVRNELAALEAYGYLYHPHTSAGRVPSDQGYRYYVQSLMGGSRLPDAEQRLISHQFHQVQFEVGEWIHLAASVLASHMHNTVVVAPPVAYTSRLRRVDLVRIGADMILLVVMLQSGAVRQQMIRTSGAVSARGLTRLANEWNDLLVGMSAATIREFAIGSTQEELLLTVAHLLEEADRLALGGGDVHLEGLSYIAAQPEFGTGNRLQPIVEALERYGVLNSLMEPVLRSDGVYVAIGQEQFLEPLRECSVVLARYGQPGEMLGAVGVIGPTRLPYWRAVPMVSYIAAMLDRLLLDTFLGDG
jgi:heat-inducible transcriptional repressor